jgi:hypothetical protein
VSNGLLGWLSLVLAAIGLVGGGIGQTGVIVAAGLLLVAVVSLALSLKHREAFRRREPS